MCHINSNNALFLILKKIEREFNYTNEGYLNTFIIIEENDNRTIKNTAQKVIQNFKRSRSV